MWKLVGKLAVGVKQLEIVVKPRELENTLNSLEAITLKRLKLEKQQLNDVVIKRKSLDARKQLIRYIIRVEAFFDEDYAPEIKLPSFPELDGQSFTHIVGFGPAGLFAALKCLELGIKPIVIERGKYVKDRRRDVAKLNRDGILDPESNYCFGEGGAGTFSDGKLYTRSQKRGKIAEILNYFYLHGANENILYEAHPHIGTNKLPGIIENLRETIIHNGGEVRFESKLTDFKVNEGEITALFVNGIKEDCQNLVLATGHSARDIFKMLHQHKLEIEAKPFAMGFRIEHPQELINNIQYHNKENAALLPPASYSLVKQVKGKGAFSFCMCPGGIIAPATTTENAVVVNGWSPSKRNGQYANSGWVTEIDKEEWSDYADKGPLAGLHFQQFIEQRAYKMAKCTYKVPAQNFTDYLNNKKSEQLNESSFYPGMESVNLNNLYPKEINYRLREGLRHFAKTMKGFNSSNAIIVAPESRTSSPVRIPRTTELSHPDVNNLYPCGEGAGYAGGIISAALDGVRVAKSIAYKKQES